MEMEENPGNAGNHPPPSPNLQNPSRGDDLDSSCSTPYVSAPSSPGRGPTAAFFFSAPASPVHFILSSSASLSPPSSPPSSLSADLSSEFDFSSRFPPSTASSVGSMISADEIFLNGQIRPMKLSSHLQRPQALSPLLDLEEEEDGGKGSEQGVERGRDLRLRSKSVNRRARSMSPMRKSQLGWREEEVDGEDGEVNCPDEKQEAEEEMDASTASTTTTPSVSASTSRSSSGGGSSKRWISLTEFLFRSKSEGRGNGKEKFWQNLSFSPSSREKKSSPSEATAGGEKEKEKGKCQVPSKKAAAGKATTNGSSKRRGPAPSPHEMLYTANRAQAEEMKKKTFLPYRQGLLGGCLGFSSKGYGALNGFAKTITPVSSR